MRRAAAILLEMILAGSVTIVLTIPTVYVAVKYGWGWGLLGVVIIVAACIVIRTMIDLRRLRN